MDGEKKYTINFLFIFLFLIACMVFSSCRNNNQQESEKVSAEENDKDIQENELKPNPSQIVYEGPLPVINIEGDLYTPAKIEEDDYSDYVIGWVTGWTGDTNIAPSESGKTNYIGFLANPYASVDGKKYLFGRYGWTLLFDLPAENK